MKFVDGIDLSQEEILKIAKIDIQIPMLHDVTFKGDEADLQYEIEMFTKLSANDFFKVVYLDSRIIGFHVIRKHKTRPTAQIMTLWVHEDYRGQGIAKRLKDMGLMWAREQKIEYINTSVNYTNPRMLEINKAQGYEPFSVNLRMKL